MSSAEETPHHTGLFINVRPFSDPQKWKFCLFTFLPRWKWASFLRMSSDKKIRHFIIKPQGGMITHMSIAFQVQMVCILLANIFKSSLKMCCRDERERSNFVVRGLADVAVFSFPFWTTDTIFWQISAVPKPQMDLPLHFAFLRTIAFYCFFHTNLLNSKMSQMNWHSTPFSKVKPSSNRLYYFGAPVTSCALYPSRFEVSF